MLGKIKRFSKQTHITFGYYLRRQMLAPLTWFILGSGLMAVNAFTFFVADLLGQNNATMAPFWGFLPFVLAVMMPLLAMRGMAAERQMGVADWLSTKPLQLICFDLGLFKSHVMLFMIWLLMSLIFPLTLVFLGHPDLPEVAAGYVGALLLGSLFLAASFFASHVSRTLIGAFIGGVLLNLMILFSAVDGIAGLSPSSLPAEVQNGILTLSPIHAYERFYGGLIRLSDVLWFVVLAGVFFLLGHVAHTFKGVYPPVGKKIAGIVIVLLAFGVVGHGLFSQSLDVSKKGKFQPSDHVYGIISDVPTPEIHLTYFYSSGNRSMPSGLRSVGQRVLFYLQTLASESEKIKLKVVDPSVKPEHELAARRHDMEPHVSPDSSRSYLGVHIQSGQKDIAMPALNLRRQHMFEFDLMNNIARLRHEKMPRIVVLTGLNMSDADQRPAFFEMLMPFYRVDVMNHTNALIPDQNDLVIVYGGTLLREKAIYALDQYIQRGGRVLFLMDPFWFSAPAGRLQAMGNPDGASADNNIFDLMAHLGLKFLPGEILADNALGTPIKISEDAGVTTHPLWLTLGSGHINQKHPMSKNLSKITLAASGLFHPQVPEGVTLTPILSSTQTGHILPRRSMYQAEIGNIASHYQGAGRSYLIGAELSGLFPSLFTQRPAKAQHWFDGEANTWAEDTLAPHVADASAPSKIFALADMDMISPQLAAIGDSLEPANDNFNMALNAVRYLLDEPEALRVHLRHEASKKPFVRLDRILSDLTQALAKQERQLVDSLMRIRAKISDKRQQLEMKSYPDVQIEKNLYGLRIQELTLLHKLDDLRQQTFKAARYFISLITGVNVFGGLVMLLVFGLYYRHRHFRKLQKICAV